MLFQQYMASLSFLSVLKIPLTHGHISPVLGEHCNATQNGIKNRVLVLHIIKLWVPSPPSPLMDVMGVELLLGLVFTITPLPGKLSSICSVSRAMVATHENAAQLKICGCFLER